MRLTKPLIAVLCLLMAISATQAQDVEANFKKAAQYLDPGGDIYVYMDMSGNLEKGVKAARESFVNDETPFSVVRVFNIADQMLRELGLYNLETVGASAIMEGDFVIEKSFLGISDNYPGIWKIGGDKAEAPDGIRYAPPSTGAFIYATFDLPYLMQMIPDVLNKSNFAEAAGVWPIGLVMANDKLIQFCGPEFTTDALLKSLGKEWVVFTDVDRDNLVSIKEIDGDMRFSAPMMNAMFMIEAGDAMLYQAIVNALTRFNMPITPREYEGAQVMAFPTLPASGKEDGMEFSIQKALTPVLAYNGEFVMIASDLSLLDKALATKKSGKDVTGTVAYQNITKGFPMENNSLIYMGEPMMQTYIPIFDELLAQIPDAQGFDLMNYMEETGFNKGFAYVSVAGPDGIYDIERTPMAFASDSARSSRLTKFAGFMPPGFKDMPVGANPFFYETASKVDTPADFFLYTNLEDLRVRVRQAIQMPGMDTQEIDWDAVDRSIEIIGFDAFKDVSISARENGSLYQVKSWVAGDMNRPGAMTLFGTKPHAFKSLEFAPADTLAFFQTDFDVEVLYGILENLAQANVLPEFTEGYGEFKKGCREELGISAQEGARMVGKDFTAFFRYVPNNESVLSGIDLSFVLNTKDKSFFDLISRIVIDEAAGFETTEVQHVTRQGYETMILVNTHRPDEKKTVFYIAYGDGCTLMTLNEKYLDDMIAAKKSGKTPLAQTEGFQKMRGGLKLEGNGLAYISPNLRKELTKLLENKIKADIRGLAFNPQPLVDYLAPALGGAMTIRKSEAEGIIATTNLLPENVGCVTVSLVNAALASPEVGMGSMAILPFFGIRSSHRVEVHEVPRAAQQPARLVPQAAP